MKRLKMIAAFVLLALALNSCEKDRWGFDNRVIFSADGGSKSVQGNAPLGTLSIGSNSSNTKEAIDIHGDLAVTYDWLTATAAKGDNEVYLVALPNHTGKNRKLHVYSKTRDDKVINITVIQEK